MSYNISEYIDYLFTAVNGGSSDYHPDDVKDSQPVRFFVSGRWADAVWKTIDTLCNEDSIDRLAFAMTIAIRVESERKAHVVIETHDRLLFDMALSDSRFQDREAAKGQRTELNVHDCICGIAQFKRYTIKPKAAKAMLTIFNERRTQHYEDYSEYPEHQAEHWPEGPRLLSSPEDIYLSATLRRYCPEGCVGSTWVEVLPNSWTGVYIFIMREHLRAEGVTRLTKDRLEYERVMLPDNEWINGYTDHLTAKEWRVVYTGLRIEMREDGGQDEERAPIEISEGWLGLRELTNALCIEKELSLRDSTIISHYMVPEVAGETKVDLRKRLLEGELKNLRIKGPAFNDVVRRKVSKKGSTITNTDLGRLGEAFTHRLLTPLIECHVGPASAGVCDISDVPDGDPSKANWSVNVKMSLEDELNRSFEVSPECQVARSWVLLIMPRQLQMYLYLITGEQMTINSASGGLCVSPEGLAGKLEELIEK